MVNKPMPTEDTLSETDYRLLLSPAEKEQIKELHGSVRAMLIEFMSLSESITMQITSMERHLYNLIRYKPVETIMSTPKKLKAPRKNAAPKKETIAL